MGAFEPIGPDVDFAQEVATIRRARGTVRGLIQGMRFGFDMLERCHDDILALCRDADAVVVPTAVAAGKNEAELLGLPCLSVTLMPWGIPWRDPERPFLKRVTYGAIDGLVHLITTRPLNRIRGRLGLPPVGQEGLTSARLDLVPVSPAVFPPNPLWEPHHRVVGYWFAEAPAGWEPPKDLSAFLAAGPAPILVSLGAMSLGDPDAPESASLFVDAVEQAGVRAIIQGWETGIRELSLPPSVCASGPVPHGWLLPQCSGVVHHGGFGTTAAGLRAGIPALVVPHVADQFYWGRLVRELGVGPEPVPRAKVDASRLAVSLEELAQDAEMAAKAFRLGARIRSENGIENAVNLIEQEFA